MEMANRSYDVVIVGGGMVGATLACALGDTALRVAVIDPVAAPTEWADEAFDIRVSAITRATERVFANLGAWEGMVTRRVAPYREMRVWDATGSGSIHFDAAEVGEPDLGHIIENRVILAALLERMAQFDNIELICPAEPGVLEVNTGSARLTLKDRRTLEARLVVGADGSASWVRDRVGIPVRGWRYDQTAVVCTVKTSRHHQDTAWQRFMPTGPLAFLPLPEGYSSIVWSTTPEKAEALVAMESGRFLDELQHAFGEPLGRMESVGPRGAFPLSLQHAERYVEQRIALVGNAAHTVHPLAGQGLNLGVLDAAALAEVVLTAETERRDIGALKTLRRYERWRKGDNVAMLAAMDGFKRLFSNDVAPLAWGRNLGLRVTDHLSPVKRFFMRRALGVTGDLPRLARA